MLSHLLLCFLFCPLTGPYFRKVLTSHALFEKANSIACDYDPKLKQGNGQNGGNQLHDKPNGPSPSRLDGRNGASKLKVADMVSWKALLKTR